MFRFTAYIRVSSTSICINEYRIYILDEKKGEFYNAVKKNWGDGLEILGQYSGRAGIFLCNVRDYVS